ncbi:MAG: septum formation initiator family protein [Chloroflexota bacterium]|nr:septum formation initiator family protein [Chloroflexota bacterium]MDE3194029.1 septum formation initiator family protein [Chloroflexota bacterium]
MTTVAFAAPRRYVRARRTAATHRTRSRALPRHVRSASRAVTWELRSFVGASAAIAVAFVLALAYLAGSTGVASVGYEAQRLEAQRDELRRQNDLLQLELARLDSPARIEAEAKRLGLVRVPYVPVVTADPVAAHR